jgi:NhaP-type Na+/H+ or K+/H+ antiporter
MSAGLAALSLLIVLYGLIAVQLGRWSVSMPMVFVAVGFLLGPSGTKLLPLSLQAELVKDLTGVALALTLFANSSTLRFQQVRKDVPLVARLLVIGLTLTVGLGATFAAGLLLVSRLAYAILLGAILAPTDAVLDLPIFTGPRIPTRIQRALNVESGLNDGIVTPIVALCLADLAVPEPYNQSGEWFSTAVLAIAVAIAAGVAVGGAGGWLLVQTHDRTWTSSKSERIAILGLGLTAYLGAVALHGNGFIAAFITGVVFAAATRNWLFEPTEFTETISAVLSLLVWVIFGAVLVPTTLSSTTGWRPIAYAFLSLTLVRMVAVAVALIGTRLRLDTVLLMGWFGPRGLASVAFTLIAYTQLHGSGQPIELLMTVATWTILLSVLAHGLSAQPLSAWYASRTTAATAQSAELRDVPG